MSITAELEQILSARYGKDVRQAIHDSIEEGYNIAVQAQGTAETSADSAEAYATAALASEQNAQDYMELAEQYKNEAFAGTPTGYSDLVAKVNSIYKQTASSFGVADTVEGLALAHTIYGMSEQDGTPTPSVPVNIDSAVANFKCVGKNLIPYPYHDGDSKTISGVTFVANSDGGVLCNGENDTRNINYWLKSWNKGELPYGTYTINCIGIENAESSGVTIRVQKYKNGSWASNIASVTRNQTSATFTLSDTDDYDRTICVIQIADIGTQMTNLLLYPMVRLTSVTDSTYEPYQSKSITTGLTLRSIEVTSSDDYNLVKDGKYYIADTLDWDEDSGYSITRRIGNIDSYDSESLTTIWMSSKDVYAEGTAPTSGANVTYILTTTTSESVSSANAQALLGLKTYDEATSIDATGDVAPSITLEYSKDRTTALGLMSHNLAHINSLKIADLS